MHYAVHHGAKAEFCTSRVVRGRPEKTSDFFCPFLIPPSPMSEFQLLPSNILKNRNLRPPFPPIKYSNVFYGWPLSTQYTYMMQFDEFYPTIFFLHYDFIFSNLLLPLLENATSPKGTNKDCIFASTTAISQFLFVDSWPKTLLFRTQYCLLPKK